MPLIVENWPILLLVAALLLCVLLALSRRKPKDRYQAPDALDEGAAPAQRNQVLIDAPPAAVVPLAGAAPTPEPITLIAEQPLAAAPNPISAPIASDDLSRIKGLGPKLQALLPTLGITSFAQIAAWTDDDLVRIDSQLGAFAGRPVRDSWIEQAKYLAAEDVTGFEARFGKV